MKKTVILIISVMLLFVFCGIPCCAQGDGDLIMSSCDTTEFWAANSQGADALESESVNKTEGSGSVGATAVNGKLNQIVFTPASAMDITKYSYLEFDIYFSDLTWFNDCGAVMMELTSSGTCDKESNRYMKKVMRILFETGAIDGKDNWWHFVLELDNPQGNANGKLNKESFNYFRFYTVDPITTTPDYTMRIDDMRFTNNPSNYTPPEDEKNSSTASEVSKPSDPMEGIYTPKIEMSAKDDATKDKSGLFIGIIIAEAVLIAVAIAVGVVMILHFNGKNKKHL